MGKEKVVVLPLAFALLIGMFFDLVQEGAFGENILKENIDFAGKYLDCKLCWPPNGTIWSVDIAPKIREIMSIGFVFLLQEIGNLGTVVLGYQWQKVGAKKRGYRSGRWE